MTHDILSVKLYELDKAIGQMHSRIEQGEMDCPEQVEKDIQELRRECRENREMLHNKMKYSKAKLVGRIAEAYDKVDQVIQIAQEQLGISFTEETKVVGERIRYYRKQQKLTLRELGEKCGFMNRGDVRIAQYENGSRTPKTGTLKRIAAALGVEPEELFCEDCRKCMFLKNYYRKKRGHLIPDEGIDEDYSYRKHADPDDEGILYDNLD